jgi:hypothetical protein
LTIYEQKPNLLQKQLELTKIPHMFLSVREIITELWVRFGLWQNQSFAKRNYCVRVRVVLLTDAAVLSLFTTLASVVGNLGTANRGNATVLLKFFSRSSFLTAKQQVHKF